MTSERTMYTGVGKIRIFSDQVRRGISVIEDYVYKAIEKGCEPIVVNAIVHKRGRDILAPTIITYKQIRVLVAEAYESVRSGYEFFRGIDNEAEFKRWLTLEMQNRISRQVGYLGMATEEDFQEAADLIVKRTESFNAYMARTEKNPAQQRHEDLQNARIIAKRCWDNKATVNEISAELKISPDKIEKIRRTVMYLREVRVLATIHKKPSEIIKWVKSYRGREHIFAKRMGLREDIAKYLLVDVLHEFSSEEVDIAKSDCERAGQKNLTGKYKDGEASPTCPLCGAVYYLSPTSGFYTHP